MRSEGARRGSRMVACRERRSPPSRFAVSVENTGAPGSRLPPRQPTTPFKRRRGFMPAADADFHTKRDHSTQPRAFKRFEQQVDEDTTCASRPATVVAALGDEAPSISRIGVTGTEFANIRPSAARTEIAVFAGVSGPFESFDCTTENRGVPGSSPGLAIAQATTTPRIVSRDKVDRAAPRFLLVAERSRMPVATSERALSADPDARISTSVPAEEPRAAASLRQSRRQIPPAPRT
jgi:hypothetical protein